ncbi:cilia- and flagella-associated protein 99 isoform X1 [Pygocentrus nattereri]|uniref:cilia- and flagella-associated protein 99 isoform X1 n=1 Tax=Pygocentrus nattereri TaxID=42514 RepID=UPI000814595B|nr:cilia- and flagella-associated protein 99 isoform X1 [Pygocentrus nattereri]
MNYRELVREAITLLDKYEPDKQSVDSFIEDSAKTLGNHPSADQTFISDTVYGCVEHRKLLDIVVNVFYDQHGKSLFKADRNKFVVVCYLSMFHLEDLGLEQFSRIIKSLDTSKMHKFLSFFFNVTNLTTWIHGEWSQIYDATYVEHKWIAPLLRWQAQIEGLLDYLSKKMTKGSLPRKSPKKCTQSQEFDLTKPKPRPLPAPEPVPQQEKTKPVSINSLKGNSTNFSKVPLSTHRAPKEPQLLEDIKQKNHLKAQQVLYEANIQQFRCANQQKSEKTQNTVSQIQQNFNSKLKFDSVYSSGTPATQKMNILPVRLNTTAILREGALYNRQMEEELNRLEHLMQGANEPSAFLQWQKEMREKDLQEELAQVERRRLEGKISYEEALLARQRVLELNQHKAQLKKEETAELMRKYAEKRLREEEEMKELVQQVASGHKNSKAAKIKLQEIKQRIVKEVSEQSRELLRQALEEAQAELSRRFELIRQIRAIESVPHNRHMFLDDTQTGGHELLCEMSLVELRERLARLREEEQREQEEKRHKIQEEKQSREQLLLEQLDTIAMRRTAARHATTQKQEEKKKRRKLQEAVSMDERVMALQKTLEMKQQERQNKRESEKGKVNISKQIATQKVKSYNQEKQALEEQHWLQLEQALERQVRREASSRNTSGLNYGKATNDLFPSSI